MQLVIFECPQGIELMQLFGLNMIRTQRGCTIIMFVLYYSHLVLLNLSRGFRDMNLCR